MNLVHTITPYFLNILLLYPPTYAYSSKRYLPFSFPDQNTVRISPSGDSYPELSHPSRSHDLTKAYWIRSSLFLIYNTYGCFARLQFPYIFVRKQYAPIRFCLHLCCPSDGADSFESSQNKPHVNFSYKSKRKQLNLKTKPMHWLLGRRSALSTESRLLLYKAVLKPIWTYGIQLWGTASNCNIANLQRFQSKTLDPFWAHLGT
jgi:hypothetical protein